MKLFLAAISIIAAIHYGHALDAESSACDVSIAFDDAMQMARDMECDFDDGARVCHMAAFAISGGYADDEVYEKYQSELDSGKKGMEELQAIVGAYKKGLEAVVVNKVHQICDPYPTTPKTTLDMLENVGECLKGMCVYNEGC